VLKLTPDELVRLTPRLTSYLPTPDLTWPQVADASAFLRADLDVSKSLWGEVCLVMGREKAAIAIAIVSTKDPAHFRTSAGFQLKSWRGGPLAGQPPCRRRHGGSSTGADAAGCGAELPDAVLHRGGDGGAP
jgi:hypothetical protein